MDSRQGRKGTRKYIAPLVVLTIALCSAVAHAGYFYLTAQQSGDDDRLVASATYSTLSACQTAEANASLVIQDCVATCNSSAPTTTYYLEQYDTNYSGNKEADRDCTRGTSACFLPSVGPYGNGSDCLAGINDAGANGFTVVSACMVVSAKRKAC